MSDGDAAKPVLVEVLTASGCGRCQRAKALAHEVAAEFGEGRVRYRERDVVEDIDYAVGLGVLCTPAIALDGELVFRALPGKAALREAIARRLEAAEGEDECDADR